MQELESITNDWINQYTTENSKQVAKKVLRQFTRYLENNKSSITEYIDTIALSEKDKFREVNHFINSLGLAPASVRQSYSFFKSYLRVIHGIKIDIEDRRQFIKFQAIPKINRFPITAEIIKDFCLNAIPLHRTFYLIQTSSGMRASESLKAKKENFDFSSSPVKITLPAKITKTKQERITFISKEAYSSLSKIIDEYFQEKTLNKMEQYFYQLRQKLNYIERYEDSINYKINIHSMRAFFRTASTKANINPDISETLIGHSGYLKTYKRFEESDLIDAYKKIEPKLKIF